MPDFLSPPERSVMMAKVRNRGTKAERQVRSAVWHAGFRYRLNDRKLPGAPDLVLKRYRTAVLVQGCFWHGHSCRKGQRRPGTNVEFWRNKLDANLERDGANQSALKELGWRVFVLWECELKQGTETLINWLSNERSRVNATV